MKIQKLNKKTNKKTLMRARSIVIGAGLLAASTLSLAAASIENRQDATPYTAAAPALESDARFETTNMSQSLPLNVISRAFSRLEAEMDDLTESQRLTYRILDPAKSSVSENTLKQLLIDIAGGQEDASVHEIKNITAPSARARAIELFAKTASLAGNDDERKPELVAAFGKSVDTALSTIVGSNGVQIFLAKVLEQGEVSHVLIFSDVTSNDVLLLYLSNAPVLSN